MDVVYVVDLRTVSFDVPPQEILTKDSVTVQVDAVVYYNIDNPMDSLDLPQDFWHPPHSGTFLEPRPWCRSSLTGNKLPM